MPQAMLSVDQVLTRVEGMPAASDLDPYLLTMVFANAAARAGRKAVADPAAAAQAFAQQWGQRLGQVGWVVTAAGTSRLMMSGTGQTATVADRILQAAGPDSGAAAVMADLQSRADGEGAVVRLWWSAVCEGPMLQGAIGQVSAGADGLRLALVSFTLDGSRLLMPREGFLHRTAPPPDLSTPQVLFQELQAGSIDLTTSALTAVLQGDVYASQKPDLDRMVGAKMAAHVAAEPPSLVTLVQP